MHTLVYKQLVNDGNDFRKAVSDGLEIDPIYTYIYVCV